MAGKLCNGDKDISAVKARNSIAYCEGLVYRAGGTAVARPKTDNPQLAGSEAADAWDLGWEAAQASAGSAMTKADVGCCAVPSGAIPV